MLIDFLNVYFKDEDLKNIVTDIMGTSDPSQIQSLINKYAVPYCAAKIENILFLEPSAGAVFGFLLKSGEKVVLKIFNKRISYTYLEKMNDIQKIFFTERFPAPNVLSPIFRFNDTHAGLYQLLEGNKENSHDSDIRSELAKYLAKFSDIVDKYQFEPMYTFMQESMKNKLWPTPHNVLFDLRKSSRGAAWITDRAKEARKIIKKANFKPRLAYTDWNVKNTIFNDNKLVGVFDWDALGAMSEPEMVGSAAAQFTADWESGNKVTPTPDEGRLFVQSYETYRGREFTKDEYRVASAAADYVIALISRFEHAGNNNDINPYQNLLRSCSKSFLYA